MSEITTKLDLFLLNKNILNFIIKPYNNISTINNILSESNSQLSNPTNNNNSIKYKSECILKVSNISQNYIVFRTKTTKKKFYVVQPSHCIIKPNSTISISIEFISKEKNFPSNSGHKFKFEAIQIFNNNLLNLEPKQIFEEIFNENNLQQIYSKKLDVEFINEETYLNDNNNIINNNKINNDSFNSSVNESSIYKSVKYDNDSILNSNNNYNIDTNINKNNNNILNNLNKSKINNNIKNNINKTKENNLEELNNLKVEYFKLLDQLNDISKDYNNLKNKLDKEKNLNLTENNISNLYNNKYHPNELKESKISINLALIICFISMILGFYLTD